MPYLPYQATDFYNYLNLQHPNIKFTDEHEKENKLPFLDICIEKGEGDRFLTSIYHNSSYTGLLTSYLSYIPKSYKLALVKTLIDRIYKICNNWKCFHKNITELTKVLKRNMYPKKFMENEICKYLNNKIVNKKAEISIDEIENTYFKLPYIGPNSINTRKKINNLCKELCKSLRITLCFSVNKIGASLSTKCKLPCDLKSFVVYQFDCAGCGASYIGETTRHLKVRIREHIRTDKAHL